MATVTLRARSFAQFTLSGQSKILRCAQNDRERVQDDTIIGSSRKVFSRHRGFAGNVPPGWRRYNFHPAVPALNTGGVQPCQEKTAIIGRAHQNSACSRRANKFAGPRAWLYAGFKAN